MCAGVLVYQVCFLVSWFALVAAPNLGHPVVPFYPFWGRVPLLK